MKKLIAAMLAICLIPIFGGCKKGITKENDSIVVLEDNTYIKLAAANVTELNPL